jgi:hypothetical protein
MAITPCDSSLIINVRPEAPIWAAFEYQASLEPGTPPTVIYVGAAILADVYRLVEGRTNSEFVKLFANGGHVLVRIIATGERIEIIRFAQQHMRTFDPMPRCNVHGFNIKGISKAVMCSNGKTYPSQTEAARDLGVSQSAISQCLGGKISHVNGLTFSYALEGQ